MIGSGRGVVLPSGDSCGALSSGKGVFLTC